MHRFLPSLVSPVTQDSDVEAYVAASVAASAAAASDKPRCATGHSTCTHAHLGIGPQCEPGACRVDEADAGEGVAHG